LRQGGSNEDVAEFAHRKAGGANCGSSPAQSARLYARIKHKETRSAHIVLVHPYGRRTTVSRHSRTIPRGTLGGILRDVNISTDEFLIAYKPKYWQK